MDGATFVIEGAYTDNSDLVSPLYYFIDKIENRHNITNIQWLLHNASYGFDNILEIFVPYGSFIMIKSTLYKHIKNKPSEMEDYLYFPFSINTLNNKEFYAAGTPMSLIYGDEMSLYTSFTYIYYDTFKYSNMLSWSLPNKSKYTKNGYPQTIEYNGETIYNPSNLIKILNPLTFLPAQVLCKNCYSSLFDGCYKLKIGPVLPAKILKPNCYYSMFGRCYNLNKIFLLAEDLGDFDGSTYLNETALANFSSKLPNRGIIVKNKKINNSVFTQERYLGQYIPETWSFIDYKPDIIEFKILNTLYLAEEGMTWADFYVSEYNVNNIIDPSVNPGKNIIYDNLDYNVMNAAGFALMGPNKNPVLFGDIIEPNTLYEIDLSNLPY